MEPVALTQEIRTPLNYKEVHENRVADPWAPVRPR